MNRHKHWLFILLKISLLSCFLLGCVSSKYIERKQYLLETPESLLKKSSRSSTCPMVIEHVTALAPFDQLDFLYRVESTRYLVDYYHGFLVPPAEQLDAMLRSYFRGYGSCNTRLQVKLIELYADYRDHDHPQAVITLQFILTKLDEKGKNLVLADKVLHANIPLCEKNTTSLLRAWDIGVQNVFAKAQHILNQTLKRQK